MPPHSAGPPPTMFNRAGPSTLDERVSSGFALTCVDAS
jgi:hypothetical protein